MKIVVLSGGFCTERHVGLVSGSGVCRALREKGHQAIFVDMFMGLENYSGALENIFDAPDGLLGKTAIEETAPDLEAVRASRQVISMPVADTLRSSQRAARKSLHLRHLALKTQPAFMPVMMSQK